MKRIPVRTTARIVRRLRSWRRAMTTAVAERASTALSALLAGLLLAWAGSLTVLPMIRSEPADLVEDYLNALRDKDIEAALDIAGVSPPTGDKAVFLTAKALSADWSVDSVRQLAAVSADSEFGVTATISDESGRATRGQFHVSQKDGGWRIRNPFVEVTGDNLPPLSYLDLNGVSAALPAPGASTEAATFRVFPGSYRLYAGNASLLTTDPGRVLLLPGDSDTNYSKPQPLLTSVGVSAKGVKAAQKAVNSLIDECAASDEANPPDCPFAGADDLGWVDDDGRSFSDVKDVKWKVGDYPKVGVTNNGAGTGFSLTQLDDATIRLSATAVAVSGSDKRVKLTADCAFAFDDTRATLSASGSFTISLADNAVPFANCDT